MTDTERRKRLVKWLDRILKTMRSLSVSTYYKAIEALKERIESGEKFVWNDRGVQERKVMSLLKILEGKINILIGSGVSRWYQEGLDNAAEQIEKQLTKSNRQPYGLDKLKKQATRQRRMEAVAGHAQTVSYRDGAMNNLSNRVWDLKREIKKDIEKIVQDTIEKGQGVNEAKNSVKEFLNTDGNGQMKHGGKPGVYKNPIKNCERLLRTEVNAAYRSAEIDSYNAMDVVLGYEIHLSGNHTTTRKNAKGEEKIIELNDICDQCAGKYPKNFVWFGWHPNCRCYITPITMTHDQLAKYWDAQDEGREKEYLDSIMIKDFPDGFKQYFAAHAASIVSAVAKNPKRQLPTWFANNQKILTMFSKTTSKQKYDSYSSDYEKTYFNEKSNGYIVTDKQRIITATQNEEELHKYIKEHNMCVTFANAGHSIEHLSEISGVSSSDVNFDGIPAELKKTKDEKHIINYAIKATTKQGAQIVLFQVDVMNAKVRGKFKYLSKHGIHGYYFITGDENNIIQY